MNGLGPLLRQSGTFVTVKGCGETPQRHFPFLKSLKIPNVFRDTKLGTCNRLGVKDSNGLYIESFMRNVTNLVLPFFQRRKIV